MSILKDYAAYAEHSGSKLKPFVKTMFYCNIFFRVSHVLYKIKLIPLARVFWLINRILFSVEIDPRAKLRGGFVILHGTGVTIGHNVLAEGNFKVYQGATIGGNIGKKRTLNGRTFSQPWLQSDVVVGINAVVAGPVVLGAGSRVGANSVVTKDVPAGATVVSNNVILAPKAEIVV
ncbi:serine O-acetyltransferase [Dyadobacter sp. BHUBP1]|uniref:serine O-acetyltransferase n=1 Tax=Dyadobacter sp. BHUBP1 TaxID=3424178 RepID=UPI003D332DC0